MKRILVSLIAASGLALLAASPAGAVNSLCGHSYAMLLQGAAPNDTNQTGVAPNPGALTAAAGVGVITFGAASGTICASIQGEMIFNEGDIQNNGNFFGPADCYDSDSLLTAGLPCFDGENHFVGSTMAAPGANGNGSTDLTIDAGYGWFNDADMIGSQLLHFTLQAATGGAIVVGTSKPQGSGGNVNGPVLTLTLQKQTLADCGTTYGAAPYLGNLVVSCSSYGANASDFVSASQGNGLSGGFGSLVGDVEIFSDGEAGGSISFNSNNNDTASGFTGTTPSNSDCSIAVFPGVVDPGYASGVNGSNYTQSQYADCTSNSVATIDNSTGSCTDDLTAGAGYANASVAWGATDTAAYLTTVGVTSAATGFLPPGTIGTCTTYAQSPAGKLSTSATVTQALTNSMPGVPVTKNVKITNGTPADCHLTVALTGTLSDAHCALSLTGSTVDVPGDTIDTSSVNLHCVCDATEDDPGLSGTLNISAPGTYPAGSCPVATGGGPVTVTCTN